MITRVVDLSSIIKVDSAVYPGFPKIAFNSLLTINKDGANVAIIRFATHVGTHIDAPFHMIKGGQTVDEIPVELFIGNAVLIDATKTSQGSEINPKNIQINDVNNKDIVIVKTRYCDDPDNISSYSYPSLEFGELLLRKKIKLYCTDAPSVDPSPSVDEPNNKRFLFHKLMFKHGVPIVEGLVNLSKLNSAHFLFVVLPLKLAGLDGSPCRAIAIEGVDVIKIVKDISVRENDQ